MRDLRVKQMEIRLQGVNTQDIEGQWMKDVEAKRMKFWTSWKYTDYGRGGGGAGLGVTQCACRFSKKGP